MNEPSNDPVLDAVRAGLAGVRMTRPVDAIVRLARARRRQRVLGATGAAGVAGLALAGMLAFVQPPGGAPTAVASPSPSAHPAGFTLVLAADGTYTFDVVPGVPLDTAAVERALDGIGVSAVVRIHEMCSGNPVGRLDPRMFSVRSRADGTVSLTIDSRRIAASMTLSMSLTLNDRGGLAAIRLTVFWKGTQSRCSRMYYDYDQPGSGTGTPR